jgi:hypothetical protein
MANKNPKKEYLVSLGDRSTIEQRKIQSMGGLKSGEVRKEKKIISQMLADYLAKDHDIVIRDDSGEVISKTTLSAEKLISQTVTAILSRGDGASASMIKTLGELTEGQKINMTGELTVSALTPEERRARIDELERKRKV